MLNVFSQEQYFMQAFVERLLLGLRTLLKMGYARFEEGRLIIIADRCDVGEACDEKGNRGLAVGFSSELLGVEVHFVLSDKQLLRIARRIIDDILEGRSYR